MASYYWVFPNLMLNVYPDNFSTNLILPLGHGRTLTLFEWYFRDPDAGDGSEIDETSPSATRSSSRTSRSAKPCSAACARRRTTSGRYSPQRENGVHHFHGALRWEILRV